MAEHGDSIAVVVGATGGIGRAMAEALVRTGHYRRVVGLSRRRPDDWNDDGVRTWAQVDILDEASLREAAAMVANLGCLTRLVVATGRLSAGTTPPEKAMGALDAETLASLFAVNAIGPALVAKHFLPLTPRHQPSLFAALSARVGSIGDDRLGGWYGYRASKAALNMMIRNLAIEQGRTRPMGVCVALHPGTVRTSLSAPFQASVRPDRLFSPEQSVQALMSVMEKLKPEDSGGFFAWDGTAIPW